MNFFDFLYTLLLMLLLTTFSLYGQKQDVFQPLPLAEQELHGFLGAKIDLCIKNRIMAQEPEQLIEPFRHRNETRWWQTEFWGKWFTSAVAAYQYNRNPELKKILDSAVRGLLATQTPDGYIGNYADDQHLEQWDIWGRKYTLLGLLAWYDLTGDNKVLRAARRLVDHLLTEVGAGKANIVKTGNYRGMPGSSILEPVVLLYNRTGDQRYLEFARYIVAQWETSEGPQLIRKALQGVPVARRFPHPETWWGWENGHKAYEMMSCYEGLLELYRVTGTPEYLEAVAKAVQNIIDSEINIAGSGASLECWYQGKTRQCQPALHMMETCVTMTWMKLCQNLLRLTGASRYVDLIEQSAYNALLGALTPDGHSFAKYSPLIGTRALGEDQCGLPLNCCIANGPRALMLLPQTAVMGTADGPVINLFCEGAFRVRLPSKNLVTIEQKTDYPVSGRVDLIVSPGKNELFTLAVRIPGWSQQTTILVNDENFYPILPGDYARINRIWQKGDRIHITFDLNPRLVRSSVTGPAHVAFVRGPIVLALDQRLSAYDIDMEVTVDNSNQDSITLEMIEPKDPAFWMVFKTSLVLGSDFEGEFRQPKAVYFCDFASAGNTWDLDSRYRVWLPLLFDPRRSGE